VGAGLKKAGDLWAGHELPADAEVFVPIEQAPAYDPTIRGIPFDEDGRAQTVHWVDQEVAFVLTVPLGSVACIPDVGTDVAKLKTATSDNVQTVVEDVVQRALSRLLNLKAISIDAVDVLRRPGTLAYQVHYKNLLIPSPQKQARTVTIPPWARKAA
jgi:hypothetical protein